MEAKIINYIKEKQKEYKYGSDAYNVLRHLEVTLPQFLTQPNNTGERCKLCNGTGIYHYGGSFGGATLTEQCSCKTLPKPPNTEDDLLPCNEKGCQNPHEYAYRGCDSCKFNLTKKQ